MTDFEAGVKAGRQQMIDRYHACVNRRKCPPDQLCILPTECPGGLPLDDPDRDRYFLAREMVFFQFLRYGLWQRPELLEGALGPDQLAYFAQNGPNGVRRLGRDENEEAFWGKVDFLLSKGSLFFDPSEATAYIARRGGPKPSPLGRYNIGDLRRWLQIPNPRTDPPPPSRKRYPRRVCHHGRDCWRDAKAQMPQRCVVCGSEENIQADHYIPRKRGGLDCRDNLMPLCQHHNASKHANDPVEWMRRHGFLF